MTEPDASLNTDGSEDTASDTERRLREKVARYQADADAAFVVNTRLQKENRLLVEKLDDYVIRINHLHAAIRNAMKHLEHVLP